MARRLLIVSDPHYAGPTESKRGSYEIQAIENFWTRWFIRFYRRYFWLRDPFAHNALLEQVLAHPEPVDRCVALGDYSCDTRFVGLSDDGSLESARICLDLTRAAFPGKCREVIGDHELGKRAMAGGRGGMELESWRRATETLGLQPVWSEDLDRFRLIGVTSSLAALPAFEQEARAADRPVWQRLRADHMEAIRRAFESMESGRRILLFCHDPTALPFLAEDPVIGNHLDRIERTFIGHLHSRLILWKSRCLSGMPEIGILGHSVRKMSRALGKAKIWRKFNVTVCPSPAGIELLKDGGYLTVEWSGSNKEPPLVRLRRLLRR